MPATKYKAPAHSHSLVLRDDNDQHCALLYIMVHSHVSIVET